MKNKVFQLYTSVVSKVVSVSFY